LTDVLRGAVKPELVRDRIVLIGVTMVSAGDFVSTPYSLRAAEYERMPGVIAHAQMVSQILSAVKDRRPLLVPWSLGREVLWIWLWSMVGGLIVGYLLLHRLSIKQSLFYLVLATGVSLSSLYLLCLWFLIQGSWVPLVPSALALMATVTGVITHAASQTEKQSLNGVIKEV
jgi:CHASE2 domain-containing sensor protein